MQDMSKVWIFVSVIISFMVSQILFRCLAGNVVLLQKSNSTVCPTCWIGYACCLKYIFILPSSSYLFHSFLLQLCLPRYNLKEGSPTSSNLPHDIRIVKFYQMLSELLFTSLRCRPGPQIFLLLQLTTAMTLAWSKRVTAILKIELFNLNCLCFLAATQNVYVQSFRTKDPQKIGG